MRTICTMDAIVAPNPVAALKERLDLKFEEFADKLGCSKGHASDLCTGRRIVTVKIARKLEELSGTPWHEWVTEPVSDDEPREAPE